MEQNKAIFEKLGISYLRPYQELMISYVFECAENEKKGKLLGCLPTGSGKSLCFMYPIALLRKRTVLVYPLLSLMNDQARRFEKAGIPFEILQGGLERDERLRRISNIRRNSGIAIITNVETLLSMMKNGTIGILAGKTDMMVIDEAHTAVTWGESFREAYLSLPKIINEIKPRILMAFTATMNKEIEKGIRKYIFTGDTPYTVHESTDRENIYYHSVPSLSKRNEMIRILEDPSSRPAVIFCRSRELTEYIKDELKNEFRIEYYHAGLARSDKKRKEEWFASSEDGVLAATSAYGMGVDKKNIRTVIHVSLPSSPSDFLQEAGRGGRDGRRMDSYVLWYPEEDTPLSSIFKGSGCIRTALLKAMNETPDEDKCLSCSNCRNERRNRCGEREILRYIFFHPGLNEKEAAASITAKNIFFRAHRLPLWRHSEAEKAIRILRDEGKIKTFRGKLFVFRRSWKF